jgi:hypothetical protein
LESCLLFVCYNMLSLCCRPKEFYRLFVLSLWCRKSLDPRFKNSCVVRLTISTRGVECFLSIDHMQSFFISENFHVQINHTLNFSVQISCFHTVRRIAESLIMRDYAVPQKISTSSELCTRPANLNYIKKRYVKQSFP